MESFRCKVSTFFKKARAHLTPWSIAVCSLLFHGFPNVRYAIIHCSFKTSFFILPTLHITISTHRRLFTPGLVNKAIRIFPQFDDKPPNAAHTAIFSTRAEFPPNTIMESTLIGLWGMYQVIIPNSLSQISLSPMLPTSITSPPQLESHSPHVISSQQGEQQQGENRSWSGRQEIDFLTKVNPPPPFKESASEIARVRRAPLFSNIRFIGASMALLAYKYINVPRFTLFLRFTYLQIFPL